MLTALLWVLGFFAFCAAWTLFLDAIDDDGALMAFIKVAFWIVISPVALPALIRVWLGWFFRSLWRRVKLGEAIRWREFWSNPDGVI